MRPYDCCGTFDSEEGCEGLQFPWCHLAGRSVGPGAAAARKWCAGLGMEVVRCGEYCAPGRLRPAEGRSRRKGRFVLRARGLTACPALGPAVGRGRRGVGSSSGGGAVRGAGLSCRLCAASAADAAVVLGVLAVRFLPYALRRFLVTLTDTSGLLLSWLRALWFLVSFQAAACASMALLERSEWSS